MYRFSRQIFMQIKDAIDPHPDTIPAHEARRRVLRACEETIERLAKDPRYFPKPARSLFQEIRCYFPITEQGRVYYAIERTLTHRAPVHPRRDRAQRRGHPRRRAAPRRARASPASGRRCRARSTARATSISKSRSSSSRRHRPSQDVSQVPPGQGACRRGTSSLSRGRPAGRRSRQGSSSCSASTSLATPTPIRRTGGGLRASARSSAISASRPISSGPENGAGARLRPRRDGEVGIAQLQRHGGGAPAPRARGAPPPRPPSAARSRAAPRRVTTSRSKVSSTDTDSARPGSADRPRVDAARPVAQLDADGAGQQASEPVVVQRRQVADQRQPGRLQPLVRLRADARQRPQRQRGEERRLATGRHHRHAARLAVVGGDLGHHLRRRAAERRVEARLGPDQLLQLAQEPLRLARGRRPRRSDRGSPRRCRPAGPAAREPLTSVQTRRDQAL